MDNYFCEAESEKLNLISPMSKMENEYKMATIMFKGTGLSSNELFLIAVVQNMGTR